MSVRHVAVRYGTEGCSYGSGPVVYYGQGITARILDTVTIVDPPRDEADREWIGYLSTFVAPGGRILYDV